MISISRRFSNQLSGTIYELSPLPHQIPLSIGELEFWTSGTHK